MLNPFIDEKMIFRNSTKYINEGKEEGKGILYCGDIYTNPGNCVCGTCDGQCGPYDGCPCPDCDLALSSLLYSTGKMKCGLCNKILRRINIYHLKHLQNKDISSRENFRCNICNQNYYKNYIPLMHCSKCNYIICPVCAFSMITKNELNKTNEISTSNNEIEKLKKENEILKKENQDLLFELFKANKLLQEKQKNIIENNTLKKLDEENNSLKYQLSLKDNEINDLKTKFQNISIEKPKYNMDDIMVIYFRPTDGSFHQGIKCLPTDTFAEVEEKLYKIFDDLRDTNNMFTCNTFQILRFKKLSENKIKDGDEIMLFKLE